MRLTWGADRQAEVDSADELDALLDRVEAEARACGRPQDVQLDGGPAGFLGIVVGDDRSFLNHIPADLDPPYMASVGEQDHDRPFTFYVAGDHHSEARWRNTIPRERAREAARAFLESGGLDPRVDWEET